MPTPPRPTPLIESEAVSESVLVVTLPWFDPNIPPPSTAAFPEAPLARSSLRGPVGASLHGAVPLRPSGARAVRWRMMTSQGCASETAAEARQ